MVFSCLLWSGYCKSCLPYTLLMNLSHFYPGKVILELLSPNLYLYRFLKNYYNNTYCGKEREV